MQRVAVFLVILIFCTLSFDTKAQQGSNGSNGWKYPFHSFNTLQVLNGSTTTSIAINTVNGFQWGKFFGGIGTGFDYYYHLSVPLFLEARVNILEARGRLQLFANGGLNFPFASQNNKLEYKPGVYKTGSLYALGADYLVTINRQALILGAGFSNKEIIQLVENNVWNPVLNRTENIPIKDDYTLNRIVIRVGWMF